MRRFELIPEAKRLAHKAHYGQSRKASKDPYIVHPRRVAGIVSPYVDEIGVAVAWLHDVEEDTDFEVRKFPLRVRQMVDLLTRRKGKESKRVYILRVLASMDLPAIIIKVADRIDNLEDGGKSFGRSWLKNYLKSSRLIHTMAVERAGLGKHPLISRLDETIGELASALDRGEVKRAGDGS